MHLLEEVAGERETIVLCNTNVEGGGYRKDHGAFKFGRIAENNVEQEHGKQTVS